MPFTPFHMGAALIVKPELNRNFSVITFGIAQIAIDIEPGIGMLTGADVLHGPTHTILGALVIAYFVMLIAPSICSFLLTKWNNEVNHYNQSWLVCHGPLSKTAVMLGALFGTLSHVLLDSLMHHDIHPLSPFSQENPFIGLITENSVYQACTIAGVFGIAAWLVIQWAAYNKQNGKAVAPTQTATKSSVNFFTRWVKQLCRTWLGVLLFTVVPAVFFGSAIFSFGVLAVAVVIGIPSIFLEPATNGQKSQGFRRLAIMLVIPALTLAYVSEVDAQIPGNATPFTQAIETFQRDTGNYPDSLEALIPKHLAGFPDVRFSVTQPPITYRMANGKPYLAIPSAMGDMFAQFEYDFEAKVWIHQF